ncbi:MAG: hypothetical protein QOD84_1123 [Acidobacteriaceae bacterium]
MLSKEKAKSTHVLVSVLATVFCVLMLSLITFAQDEPTPKIDIFVGYQWLHPGGSVPAPFHTPDAPVSMPVRDMPAGFGAAVTYNFHPHLGLEGDFGHNWDNYETTASVGPRLIFRSDNTAFFVHTLLSYNRLSIDGLNTKNGIGAILGGGMDLKLNRLLSFRLFEADYVWARQNYAENVSAAFPGLRRVGLEGVRLRTGLVLNFGYGAVLTPSASVALQPTEVMTGEPVTATATAKDFNPKHALKYDWSTTGGKISGTDNTARIDTNGLAAGTYTTTVKISDPKMKKGGEASATANFTVKEPPKNPPTMSCTADPTSVEAGGSVKLSCTCTSPDHVPVTVSGWSSTSGTVTGDGNNATLNTTGATPGTVSVSASCTDQRGLSTPSTTQVTVTAPAPPPPPPPQSSKLSECDYPNPQKPWRVDNTCKAVLDGVAQNLQQNAENKIVIVGNAEPTEKRKNLAAERAVNAKAYLTGGEAKQGIDPSRIEVRTGGAGSKTAEFWVVPAGANFTAEGTTPVNESKVKAVPDHPRAAAKKKAKTAQ